MKIRFIRKKTVTLPTFWGWVFIVSLVYIVFRFSVTHIAHFLSPNNPVKTEILIVEGWLPDYAMPKVIDEFNKGNYKYIVTTGINIPNGAFLASYPTHAELGREVLIKLGLDSNLVFAAPAGDVHKDRTYASALALKNWFKAHHIKPRSFNLYSLGAHTRRSWYLFRLAFNDYKTEIGVINTPDLTYDAETWWKSSKGFRTIPTEGLGFFFVFFFFHP
jgi:hypothetical protein